MKKLVLSNGVEVVAHVGDGFDGGSGVYVRFAKHDDPRVEDTFGFPIPHAELQKVIDLLAWYEREEMKLRHEEGKMWRHIFRTDVPTLESLSSPYQAAFRRGHLESHLKKCGCEPKA